MVQDNTLIILMNQQDWKIIGTWNVKEIYTYDKEENYNTTICMQNDYEQMCNNNMID